jgi:chromosome segregation ATPase
MDNSAITIELLESIRDELRGLRAGQAETNARLDQTNARLDQTNARLDQTNARLEGLERRQTEMEVRLSTELVAVVAAIEGVKTLLRDNYASTIRDLDRRVTALEARAEV